MQLYDFRIAVALALINAEAPSSDLSSDSDSEAEPRRGSVALPDRASRVSSAKHLPIACDLKNAARCRLEGCNTRVKCEKCGVFLCMSVGGTQFSYEVKK